MGQTLRYACECGYNKELLLGGGFLSNQVEPVREEFGGDALSSFDRAKKRGALTRFFWEYKRAVCPACTELLAIPVLHYWERDRERIRQAPCPECGGGAELNSDKEQICPKCGARMAAERIGLWD